MTDKNQKKQDTDHNGINPVVAAVAGAVVGAGIAVVGTVALQDEKNREKAMEVLTNAKDQAVDFVEDKKKEIGV